MINTYCELAEPKENRVWWNETKYFAYAITRLLGGCVASHLNVIFFLLFCHRERKNDERWGNRSWVNPDALFTHHIKPPSSAVRKQPLSPRYTWSGGAWRDQSNCPRWQNQDWQPGWTPNPSPFHRVTGDEKFKGKAYLFLERVVRVGDDWESDDKQENGEVGD